MKHKNLAKFELDSTLDSTFRKKHWQCKLIFILCLLILWNIGCFYSTNNHLFKTLSHCKLLCLLKIVCPCSEDFCIFEGVMSVKNFYHNMYLPVWYRCIFTEMKKKLKLWLEEIFVMLLSMSYTYMRWSKILRISWSQIPAASEFELLVSNIQPLLAVATETNNAGMAESNSGITFIFIKLYRKLTEFVHVIFTTTFI